MPLIFYSSEAVKNTNNLDLIRKFLSKVFNK